MTVDRPHRCSARAHHDVDPAFTQGPLQSGRQFKLSRQEIGGITLRLNMEVDVSATRVVVDA